jgi:hypothetical protein
MEAPQSKHISTATPVPEPNAKPEPRLVRFRGLFGLRHPVLSAFQFQHFELLPHRPREAVEHHATANLGVM